MSSHQKRTYFPALDGLRGLACLIIVVYHDFPFFHKYLFFGWAALDIFFVLSGYLITDILMVSMGEKNYLRNFYARRILRVFPLYYTSLILFLLVLPSLPSLPLRLDYFVANQAWFWVYIQNWLLILYPSNTNYALNHLWSMAVEEQFYLLWPLLVALIRKPRPLLVLMGIFFFCIVVTRFWIWNGQIQGIPYYNLFTFTRVDGLCIGCAVALLQRIDTTFIGRHVAIIVLSFAVFNFIFYWVNLRNENSFPYVGLVGYSTLSMLFGLLVYDIINQKNRIFSSLLGFSGLKFLGKISYGTYIFHWPLYLIINPYLVSWLSENMSEASAQVTSSIVASLLAFLTGFLSFRYFETPFLRMKKHFE